MADRDDHGRYTGTGTGTEDTISDHGEIEAGYLPAVKAFAADTSIDHLSVRAVTSRLRISWPLGAHGWADCTLADPPVVVIAP
ncbi:hypothetical protein [Streptomyces sp. NRRL S-920]|uniref:hypothetical protein n=1 Tax=Streptomyces sp. NRRL S-920 TaxID=1463921 RepID=UPI0004C7DC16|nr:hypothetical protein [Streptomyces sp. NRRL S-920]